MRLAISNIAWDVAEDAAVAACLAQHGIDIIDVAPGKYFPEPEKASHEAVDKVRRWWAARGIVVCGFQGLLFGTDGLNMFGDASAQRAMLDRLAAVCRIAALMHATCLVLGSPRNRDRTGLTDQQADDIAVPFFRSLGDIAASYGLIFCLEANPARYGCNFLTSTQAAARMVRLVNQPALRLQLDTGTIAVNGEPAAELIARHADIIGHVHASEPDLVPLGEGGANHHLVAEALERHLPDSIVSIEMQSPRGARRLATIDRALSAARRHYRANEARPGAAA